jgi:ABC-type branched-subunit amino acid transport system ATPase component
VLRLTVNEDRIIRAMVGRSLESRFPDRTPHIGEVFFEVRNWNVQHPQAAVRMVVKNSTITVRRGEIVGFAGLMGAGRTKLAMSIFGRSYGNFISGQIFKDGKEIQVRNVSEAIGQGLAYVSEDRKALGLNLIDDIKASIVSAKLTKISAGQVVSATKEYRLSEAYRKSLRIKTPSVDYGVRKLSGGNQQKVVLAKWMFTDPDLLILDEPTRGIDVGAMSVLQPKITDGTLVVGSGQSDIKQTATAAWKSENAQSRMDALLTSTYGSRTIDGVLSPNDTLARAIITSVKAAGKAIPVVTGQDSEAESVKSIMAGEQYSTINKDTRLLVTEAITMVKDLQAGKKALVNDAKSYNNGAKIVPAFLLPPVILTKANAATAYANDPILSPLTK